MRPPIPSGRPRATTGPADQLVLWFDLAATGLFAVEGASEAARARFDVFGILVLGFVTALGGGIIRDVLIGAKPPASLALKRYPLTAFAGGLLVFLFAHQIRQIPQDVIVILDAGGLSLFAVSGARKTLLFGLNGLSATLLGVTTGVGGGVIRDLLLTIPPRVLVADVYASAALVGAAVTTIGVQRGRPSGWMMAVGGVACFAVRMLAYLNHWSLPRAGF